MQQLDALGGQQPLAPEHPEHAVAEELLDPRKAHRRQRVEDPLRREGAVGGHDVRVEVQQVAEGVHADDQPGLRPRLNEPEAHALADDAGGYPAQISEQTSVVAEVHPQHLLVPY
jgi:hypothetical protein